MEYNRYVQPYQTPTYSYGQYQSYHLHQETSNIDVEDNINEKLISFSRFNRNNNLIKQIVNDVVVPIQSIPVSSTRLDTLRMRSKQLHNQLVKEENEIEKLEVEYAAKKAKLLQSNKNFEDRYEKLSKRKVVTPEAISKMTNYHYSVMKSYLGKMQTERKSTQSALQQQQQAEKEVPRPSLQEFLGETVENGNNNDGETDNESKPSDEKLDENQTNEATPSE